MNLRHVIAKGMTLLEEKRGLSEIWLGTLASDLTRDCLELKAEIGQVEH
jgi:hypothetical protein